MGDPYSGLFAQGEPQSDGFDTARGLFYGIPWMAAEIGLPLAMQGRAGYTGLRAALKGQHGTFLKQAFSWGPGTYGPAGNVVRGALENPIAGVNLPSRWQNVHGAGAVVGTKVQWTSFTRNFHRDAIRFERAHLARVGGRAQGGRGAWELYSQHLRRNPHAAIQTATGVEIERGARAARRHLTERYGKGVASRISQARFGITFGRIGMVAFGIDLGLMAFNLLRGQQGGPTELGPNPRFEPETGGDFVDSRLAQTQRQRALQAIHNSHLTTRAVFGNEASMMHYNS